MVRKLLIAPMLAASLALAGCATTGGSGPVIDPVKVQQIKDTATQICGYVPTVATVASVIATFTGGGAIVDMVSQAAQGICNAVTSKGARRGMVPKYRGVVIQGEFSRR